MGLVIGEGLRSTEVHQIFVVSEDLNREGRPVEIMLPELKSIDNHEEFVVVDIIVALCWGEGWGEVRAGMSFTIRVSLEEDSSRCELGGVGGNGKRSRQIWKM